MSESQEQGHGGESGISVRDAALVAGSDTAIGRATVERLREEGWRVYAGATDPDTLPEFDEGVETLALDPTDGTQARDAVETVLEDAGRIDLLVGAGGFTQLGTIEDVPVARVRRQFDENVFGPHRLLRAALPELREGGGTVVTTASVAGQVAFPGSGVYAGAESARSAMADALRTELGGTGVEVTVVEHGPVEGDRTERELKAIDRGDAYEGVYRFYEDAGSVGGWPVTVAPGEVADAVVDAATRADPPARYPVGRVARVARLTRFLPARIRDGVFGLVRRLA